MSVQDGVWVTVGWGVGVGHGGMGYGSRWDGVWVTVG